MANGKPGMGVIGLGVGSGHAVAYKGLADCRLTAICDSSHEWLEHCRSEWDVPLAFTSWREMLDCDAVEAVSVCLPTGMHHEVTIAALKAGKHVLCEKPMAVNGAEAREMARAAEDSGRILMVSYNQRFTPDIQYMKKYIADGNIGDVYFVRTGWRRPMGVLPPPTMNRATGSYDRNWFNEKSRGGGVCRDLGSHVADLALYLMGFPKVTQVVGCAYTKFLPDYLAGLGVPSDADDHSVGFVKFENGASLQFEASFGCYVETETIFQAVYGDRGGAHRESGQPLKLFSRAGDAYTTVLPRVPTEAGSTQAHFVECIREGREPMITPGQGVAVTELLDGIYASTESV